MRAYAVSSGQLAAKKCQYPKQVMKQARDAVQKQYTDEYAKTIDLSDEQTAGCGSAASYSPIMYIPQSTGILAAKAVHPSSGLLVLLGRLGNLLFYSFAIFLIIKYVRVGKWVFVAIGTFPLMIHSAASMSGDVVNNVAILAFIALTISLFAQKTKISRIQMVALVLIGGIVALTKPTNVLLFFPLLFLPTKIFVKNSVNHIPFNVHKWGLGLLLAVFSLLCIALWQHIYNAPLIAASSLHHDDVSPIRILFNTYMNPVLGYTDFITKGVVGSFSSYQYNLPIIGLVLSYGLFATTLLYRDQLRPIESRQLRSILMTNVAVFMLFSMAITYAMYTQWAILPSVLGHSATWAEGVQGRYFTPFLALLIPIGIWLRRYIRISASTPATFGLIVFVWAGSILAFYIFQTYWTFRLL